ncbi:MAG: glycosyltransferase family 4 protein [Lachnospiraceae bacterium]|nr:glycosyltransferase family 4 protein [Lachnospiraceae bacterium]
MKIAMLGHKRIPSREGGVEIVVENLATSMARLGHRVTVYNRRGYHVAGIDNGNDFTDKEFMYKGVRIISIPTFPQKALNAIVYSALASIRAVWKKFDVIHFHAEGPCALIWLPKLFGVKTVATIHGLDWKRAKWGKFASLFLKFGEKCAAKYADEIIVLSKNMQEYFRQTYARETVYIPNGVQICENRKADIIKEKYELEKDSYFLFLARVVPEKGLHYLLDAFEQLDTDKKLVIAGGCSHSEEYFSQIQDRAEKMDNVIMTGFVQGRELEELFSNCVCYILPSDVEGMPISLLEAMSYGCRCIVSDIPENTEVVKDYALTFKKSDAGDLKEKMEELLKDYSNSAIWSSDKIKKYIRHEYSWDDVAKETLKVYESIIG